MSDPSWDELAQALEQALERPPQERQAFIDRIAQGNAALRDELAALIAASDDAAALGVEARLASLASGDGGSSLAPLATGTRISAYAIDRLVGEGGMGEVYRAHRADGAFEQVVAIKLLRAGYLAAEAVRRFRVEREALARLEHPGIARMIDGGTAPDGRPYLVMQYVEGRAITAHADAEGLDVPARLRLFVQVAEAVHYAHARLVVHRDLKPSNILVGRDGRPILLDFGIARLVDPAPDGSLHSVTRVGARPLTPEHAAPEQVRGEEAGTAADVYSLGILLYELLAGTRPFRRAGRTPSDLERAVLHDDPPPMSRMAPQGRARLLRGDLDGIVSMALRKAPDRRYASALQFAEDVGRYLRGEPVLAQRDTWGYRAWKFVRRHRAGVGLGVAAAGLLALFIGSLLSQRRALARERDRATVERDAADDLLGVMTRLFQSANPTIVPRGDTVRVMALLAEAERQVDSLAAHPDRQARLQRTLGEIFWQRGELPRALRHLRPAWRQLQSGGPPYGREAVETYVRLATVMRAWEGGAVSRAMLDTAVAMVRADPSLPPRLLAEVLRERASAAGGGASAREDMDSVIALQARLGTDSLSIAASLNAMGAAVTSRDRGLAYFQASERLLQRLLPPDHPNLRSVQRNVATTFQQLGDFARAESLSAALAASAAPETGAAGEAGDVERSALLAAHRGRLEEAESGLRRALARLRTAVEPSHPLVASTLRNLGLVVAFRGRTAEGVRLLDSAVAVGRASAGATASSIAYIDGQRVLPLLRLGRLAEAHRTLRAVDGRLNEGLPTGHYALADLPFWEGMEREAAGDRAAAERALRVAIERRRAVYPATHPKVAEAECALAVVLAGATRPPTEASVLSGQLAPATRDACRRYAEWGLAEPLLIVRLGSGAVPRP